MAGLPVYSAYVIKITSGFNPVNSGVQQHLGQVGYNELMYCVPLVPELGLMQMKVVLLLCPGFKMLSFLLSLQHLQLLLSHGLLPFSLQT